MKIAFRIRKNGPGNRKNCLERGHEIVLKKMNIILMKAFRIYVAIDFIPTAAVSNISNCLHSNVPVISGTTGWLAHLTKCSLCREKNGALSRVPTLV
jgi:4-hydroxy-tetrahydrodipicolinate reductase